VSADREVLIEIKIIGTSARVAAVDVATGVEVVFQAPAQTARMDIEALAMRRLARALGEDGAQAQPPQRPGKLV
jgi:hypothetical protein